MRTPTSTCSVLFCSVLFVLASAPAEAQSDYLGDGVLIAHHPQGIEFSASEDWCARYEREFRLSECTDQNPRIDLDGNTGHSSIWYVLAAWPEEKTFAGCEFGFGQYNPDSYVFLDHGPCFQGNGLELPTSGWPGPTEGVALAAAGTPWSGNYVAVYWFAGYAYEEELIPLGTDPVTGFAGTANCAMPPMTWAAEELGALGLFRPGQSACPGSPIQGGEISGGGGEEPGTSGLAERGAQIVLAKFVPGAVTLPEGITETTLREALQTPGVFAPPELGEVLEAQEVVSIRQIVPDFDPTIIDRYGERVTNAAGEPLTVPHDLSLWYALGLAHDRVEETCSELSASPDVVVAEPDWRVTACRTPNDQYFVRQWGLKNYGQYGGVPGYDLNAPDAWDHGTGLHPARVAVLDTGIDFDHPDFHEIEAGANFVTAGPPADDNWLDDVWHGTAASGIIGMMGNNQVGGTGVGWQLSIVPVKVLNWQGGGYHSTTASALNWTRSQGIKVVNMSLGGYGTSELLRESLRNNRAAGMANIAAAGNENTNEPHYPAAYGRHCVSVNAFMMNGDRWEDARGAQINLLCGLGYSPKGSNFGITLDFTAPGGRAIFTTKHSIQSDGYYELTDPWRSCENGGIPDWNLIDHFGGTSAAAPHVSGAAALVMAMNPDLDGEDAEQVLLLTVTDHPQYGTGWDPESGWGRPNLDAALERACLPNVAERATGVSGGTATFDGSGAAVFWNVAPLPNGEYAFRRYRVDKTMALQTPYIALPVAWGRVQGAIGWPRINDNQLFNLLNEDVGTTTVVSVSSSSITVRTYYYDLYEMGGTPIGRFPNGGDVRFSYTVLGPTTSTSVGELTLADRPWTLHVTPNPASAWTAIRLAGLGPDLPTGARIGIYDASGREVRGLAVGGNASLVWDLKNDGGAPVAAGIYFLKLEERGCGQSAQRVLVVR